MKPMIGIVPLWDSTKNSYWMLPDYMRAVEKSGGVPVILPLTEDEAIIKQLASTFDGFLFSGGPDVHPSYFNEEVHPECGEICPARDTLEMMLFKEVLPLDKPILGICRGLQLINIALGGSIYQDLPSQYDVKAAHRMEAPYNREAHKVTIVPDSIFASWIPCAQLGVNSCHHQAIKDLAPGLVSCAVSEDGLIEAIHMPEKKFLVATQWHPEMGLGTNMYSENIFHSFIEACK